MYDPDTLAIGVLGKPHGLRGEIALRPYNTVGSVRPVVAAQDQMVLLVRDGQTTQQRLRSCRAAGENLLLAFAGIDSSDGVRAFIHSEVRVPRQTLAPLAPGEYYVEDVVGCDVTNLDGKSLGKASGTFWNGAHDVMTVVSASGERLIPMVAGVMVAVDAGGRVVRVAWEPDDSE